MLVGAPLDNVLALVGLGIALDFALGDAAGVQGALTAVPRRLIVGVVLGLVAGVSIGLLARWLGRRMRGRVGATALWLTAGALAGLGQSFDFSFVLGVMGLGAVARALNPDLLESWNGQLRRAFEVAQYPLFALIGFAVDLGPLAQTGLLLVAVVALGQVGRAAGSFVATQGAGLSTRERVACMLGYIPKATIQAAFAALPLDRGLAGGELILTTAVVAIVLTAPVGIVALHRGMAPRIAAPPDPAD